MFQFILRGENLWQADAILFSFNCQHTQPITNHFLTDLH